MKLTGWGRYPRIEATAEFFETAGELARKMRRGGDWIAHGMGRAYGDSALNSRVVLSRRCNKILDFDPVKGVVACESGVSLGELIDVFLPRGWFPSITPGTRFISVGGAIASDVHGKNHHNAGCFSTCVESFDLMLPDGEVVMCGRSENRELFRATCGGMGLTGVILSAVIKLQRTPGPCMRETVVKYRSLEEILEGFEKYKGATYSAAWIDGLASGRDMGRSVLIAGEHAVAGRTKPRLKKNISVPMDFPGVCLNKWSAALFNRLYYQLKPSYARNRLVPLASFFFPLDGVGQWNRMYGKSGFTQYQLVLPKAASHEGLATILKRVTGVGPGSFLAVLKLFGPENDNLLSFPMEGYTLSLDFRIEQTLFPFLDELDRIVIDHGGRLYLAKDVRMSKEVFRKGYPGWETFSEMREKMGMSGKINSLQSRRLGI